MLHHVQKLCKGCVAQHNQEQNFQLYKYRRVSCKYGGLFLIILIIADQNSYDQFRANKDRIYRIQTVGKNGNEMHMASSALPLADLLKRNYGDVEASAALVKILG